MAKARKAKEVKEPKEIKPVSNVFDYINWLTSEKKLWSELTEIEQKNFQPFILNRFLAMDLFYCEAINELQEYILGMEKDKVWRVYYELLPKEKIYIKYIKDKSEKQYTADELFAFKNYFCESEYNCIEYLLFLKSSEEGQKEIERIKNNYKYA